METIQEALNRIRNLGTPEELEARAAGSGFSSRPRRVNAHVHLPPNFSAFESVQQAVELAASQGVGILGASNYYDFGIYAVLASEARRRRIFPLFGLEIIAKLEDLAAAGTLINDPGNPGKMYICGKGITRFGPMTPAAAELMSRIRRNDEKRMELMADRMEEIFAASGAATGLSAEGIALGIAARYGLDRGAVCLQERHIAEAFQTALFERYTPEERIGRLSLIFGARPASPPDNRVRIQNEIRTRLMKLGKPAFIPESFSSFADARRLILELGGIPCYPTLADGTAPICPYEDPPEKLIQTLLAEKIYCIELIPVRNRPEVLARYVRAARAAGFIVTAGTEHNTPDLIPMEPACIGGEPIPGDIMGVFREGARVVAAHQFLRLHERCGYVDEDGKLNPAFSDGERRIEYFGRLGDALLEGYDERA